MIVKPVGLKGRDAINRMRELMGQTQINENVSPSVVELTKQGPDGKVYAIVRENHEYYIKSTNKRNNLVTEDFEYIGGLQNKKDKAYPSYAKAIKMLNLKFISLNEALVQNNKINIFENDNLISEHHKMKPESKLSPEKSFGDNSEYILDKKGDKLDYDAEEDTENHGDNVAKDGKADDFEVVKLSETEEAIDCMITGEEEEEEEVEAISETRKGFSISRAISELDDIIESTITDTSILDTLSESELKELVNLVKKKA